MIGKRFSNLLNTPFFVISLQLLFLPLSASAGEICHLETPSGYRGIGGGGRLGPYPSRASCESVNDQYFNNNGTCYCSYTSKPPTPDSDSGQGPGVNWGDIQRQQEEERKRREYEERRRKALEEVEKLNEQREIERQQKFEKDKNDALKSLKGTTSTDLKLKTDTTVGKGLQLKGIEASPKSSKRPFVLIGTAGAVKGEVFVEQPDGSWKKIQSGTSVYSLNRIRTGLDSKVQLLLKDDTVFTIGSDSEFILDEFVIRSCGNRTKQQRQY